MTEIIGRGTNRGKDLEARAQAILELEQAKAGLALQVKAAKEQIAGKYKDAAGAGYAPHHIRQCIKELLMEPEQRDLFYEEEEHKQEELDVYRHALGLADTQAGADADRKALADEIAEAGGPDIRGTIAEGEELMRRVKQRSRKSTKPTPNAGAES